MGVDVLSRKNDHLDLALQQICHSEMDSGFDAYKFEHCALPELNFDDIDISTKFLGRKLSMPLFISSITGGGDDSLKINRGLAEIANDFNIALAVGSQRCAIENESFEKSFKVRVHAPNILIFANIGAVQLNYGFDLEDCKQAVDMIDADALILHLNPMHEIFQYNGNNDFSGLLSKIEHICSKLEVPVIVKEVGYGISLPIAEKLKNIGVYAIDVAGSGSISWSEIEKNRSNDIVIKKAASSFRQWGIPTAECLNNVAGKLKDATILASGGIRNGLNVAKSIAMGAELCGNAIDFLCKIMNSRAECEVFLETLSLELKVAMFCTGSANLSQLRKAKLIKT